MPWKLAFQCMCVSCEDRLVAIQVKSETTTTVEPNLMSLLPCCHEGLRWKNQSFMMVDGNDLASLPGGLLVTPMVVPHSSAERKFPVLVANCSQRAVTIPAHTIVGNVVSVSLSSVQVDETLEVVPSKEIRETFPLHGLSEEEK